MLKPLESTTKVTAQEFMKGEVAGIRLLVALPETLIEIVKAIVDDNIRKENESTN